MVISWGIVFVSAISIILNHFLRKSCELRMYRGKFVFLSWRQAEGLVAFVMTGMSIPTNVVTLINYLISILNISTNREIISDFNGHFSSLLDDKVGLFSILMFFTGGNGVFNGLNNV